MIYAGALVLSIAIIAYALIRIAEKSIAANVQRARDAKEATGWAGALQRLDELTVQVEKVKERMGRVEMRR